MTRRRTVDTRWAPTNTAEIQDRLTHGTCVDEVFLIAKKEPGAQDMAGEVVDSLHRTQLVVSADKVNIWSVAEIVPILARAEPPRARANSGSCLLPPLFGGEK